MPAFEILIESESGSKTIKVTEVDGPRHALQVLREKYPFRCWRVINMAAIAGAPANKTPNGK